MTSSPVLSTKLSAWNQRHVNEVVEVHPDITRTWLNDGRIVCFTIKSVNRAAVDAWLTDSEAVVNMWPAEVPYLCIHDVSAANLTPYIRKQSAETVSRTPAYLKGRSAVIIPQNFANQLMRLFVTINLARMNRNIQRNVFFDRQEAINWLLAFSG